MHSPDMIKNFNSLLALPSGQQRSHNMKFEKNDVLVLLSRSHNFEHFPMGSIVTYLTDRNYLASAIVRLASLRSS